LIERRNNPTRRRILKVALKHFAEYGYPGASIQRIVTDAKITKPTLYYYFRNKKDLYQGLVAWMPGRDARQGEEECAPSVLASTDFTRPVWEQQNDASLELLRSLGCSLSFFVPALIER